MKRNWLWLLSWLAVGLVIIIAGCTVTPKPVSAARASWDGTNQTSGIINTATNGDGALVYAVVTPRFVERYNWLIGRWGTNVVGGIVPGAGLTPTTSNVWLIDAEHLSDFCRMNRWQRSSIK